MKIKLQILLTELIGYTWLTILTLGSVCSLLLVVKWFLSLVGVI